MELLLLDRSGTVAQTVTFPEWTGQPIQNPAH